MARDPNIERRMLNWMRWRAGPGYGMGLGYGSASIWGSVRVDCASSRESAIPTNAIEAEETDRAIKDLPLFLRETVSVMYLTDDPVPVKARALGCAVSTMHARVADAHRRIAIWVSDRQRHAQDDRAQVEAAQERARRASMGAALSIELPALPVRRVRGARK